MISSIEALIKSCKKNEIKFSLNKSRNILKIEKRGQRLHFIKYAFPLNRADFINFCRDKDFFYGEVHKKINTPKTLSFLDPNLNPKYKEWLVYKNMGQIIEKVKNSLDLPLIVKPNKGSKGRNIKLCKDWKEVEIAIKNVFDKNSLNYDYIALVQEYIETKAEYRAVCYKGKLQILYLKDNSEGRFEGNLSPLHWENSRAVSIENDDFRGRILEFMKPIFQIFDATYFGADIIEDKKGEFHLIELNDRPGFTIFARDNGLEELVKMYDRILKDIFGL